MDDKRFALDEATRQDAVWRYYSSPVVLQAGQVALQEQTVAFEAPAGALGIAGFLVSVQEDVGGEWVELRPNTDTYLHHFTIATNFDSPGKDFANVPLAGGRTYRLPCSNNPRFEAGNGGLGAVSYDFGKHYMSDAGHRLPRWPAGKLSMWRLGFHLLNLRDVTLPFEDAAQCRCEGIRGPTPYWQDANSTPTPETPNQLATRAAPTHLPPVAMHRDPSAGGGPAINGSIVCCTHLCRFNTSRTPTGAERPPRTFRFHVRLRWAVPDAVRAALGHEGTHHGLEPHEGSSTQHRTQRPPTGRSEQGRSDEGTHVHGTHGREASEGLLGRGYPSGALGRPLGAMLLPGFDYTESFSNQNGTAVRNARPPLSAAQQPCSLEFNFDQCSADGRVTCTPRIIGTEFELQEDLEVVAIVPHFHILTTEFILEEQTEVGGRWRTICGEPDNISNKPGASSWESAKCEFGNGKPLRLKAGTKLRLRGRFDARHSPVLGAMAAFNLYFPIDGPGQEGHPVEPMRTVLRLISYALQSPRAAKASWLCKFLEGLDLPAPSGVSATLLIGSDEDGSRICSWRMSRFLS